MDITDRANLGATLQRRNFDLTSFEFRDADDAPAFTFEGVASVVDAPYAVREPLKQTHLWAAERIAQNKGLTFYGVACYRFGVS